MSKTLQWILGISILLVNAAVVFSLVGLFFAPQLGWNNAYGPMTMGPGHMDGGRGMMGFGFPLMGIGMFWFPLLFVGLIVLGVVWLVRTVTPGAAQPPAATATCAHCGRPLQAGWKACPYCGEKV